jgi:hypothetical protein
MSTPTRQDFESSTKGMWAHGFATFGGVVLITLGLLEFLQGLSAVLKDDVFVSTKDYLYSIDLTGWGWIHVVIGAGAVVVGICILYGQTWARAAGILVAVLSAVANFAFLPYYPFWAIVVIALDVLVIWALSSLLVNT